MVVGTFSSTSYQQITDAVPNILLWMQLYILKKDLAYNLIKNAEKARCKAIVLTVDAPMVLQYVLKFREKYKLPEGEEYANIQDVLGLAGSNVLSYLKKNVIEEQLNWESVAWLRSVTKLPIILKGILTREDALEALKYDVQGIIVSNHGGRILDGVPSSVSLFKNVVCALSMNGMMGNFIIYLVLVC